MKTIFKVLSVVLIVGVLQSFISITIPDEFRFYELQENQSVTFKKDPASRLYPSLGSNSRGAFDMTAFRIDYDSGNVKASGIRGSIGIHQSEIAFLLCSGTISRKDDTINIEAKTVYDKLYLININNNGKVDSLTSTIKIQLISKTLKGNYCPSLVNTGAFTGIIALPKKVNFKEIYKPIHRPKTVGVFSYLAIHDSYGNSKVYPSGDYVLVGGNTLNVIP